MMIFVTRAAIRLGAAAFVENGDQYLIGRQLLRVELQLPA